MAGILISSVEHNYFMIQFGSVMQRSHSVNLQLNTSYPFLNGRKFLSMIQMESVEPQGCFCLSSNLEFNGYTIIYKTISFLKYCFCCFTIFVMFCKNFSFLHTFSRLRWFSISASSPEILLYNSNVSALRVSSVLLHLNKTWCEVWGSSPQLFLL